MVLNLTILMNKMIFVFMTYSINMDHLISLKDLMTIVCFQANILSYLLTATKKRQYLLNN